MSVKFDYFLTYQFKHVFWVLKRTVSLRRFFEYPQHMFGLEIKKKPNTLSYLEL